MRFDPDTFKQQFPLFSQPENSGLVYLDNAATTQRPQVVIDAISHFYLTGNANTHRSSHRLARRATEMVEQTRIKAMQFVNAGSADEVIFTRGATEGLNLLASSLAEQLQPGDEIVLTTAEHHANLVPWQMVAQRYNLVLRFVPDVQGEPQLERLPEVLSERTRILSITGASNALGFKTDLQRVRQQLACSDIVWVVDAAQLAAHDRIDVQAIGCDFLVCSAHKFYGPTGVGLLYGKRDRLIGLSPWQGGGEMINEVHLQGSTYTGPPHRFEAGTSSLGAIAGLNACLDFWRQLDLDGMCRHEQQLVTYLHQKLEELPQLRVLSRPDDNVGVAAIVPADSATFSVIDLAHCLDEQDIAVRVSHNCAMPLMRVMETQATLRVSLAAYNTRQDIDQFIAALSAAACDGECGTAPHDANNEINSLSLNTLRQLKGWQQRYRQLLKWADAMAARPEIRSDENLVKGCESAAWLGHWRHDGCHQFAIDSDARVVRGLAALLLLLINHKTTEEIRAVNLQAVFAELGLEKHLSPSRSNGFRALVDRALELAGV